MKKISYGRASVGVLALLGVLLVAPSAWAQQASGISGLVIDDTGGVLPGVTVEAASPALIEGVRTAFTDGEGRYNIVDLRPGTYTVTFSLPGFATVLREGVELTTGFTATINADMQVGSLEETITVTGASPLIDVQNLRQRIVVSEQLLDVLPSSTRALVNLINLTPGLTGVADVGGALGGYRSMGTPQNVRFHGRVGMKVTFDGMSLLNTAGDGNASYQMNAVLTQEMAMESGGISAESSSSGFAANGIPKEGGNNFSFTANGMFTNDKLNSDNLTQETIDRGVSTVDSIRKLYDIGIAGGGPIVRDRMWFYVGHKTQDTLTTKAGIFYNKTHGTPVYTPDLDRPAPQWENDHFIGGRLTWQASDRNRVAFFGDYQNVCKCEYEGFKAPEANGGLHFKPQGLYQGTWTGTMSNRLLLEAGWSYAMSNWPSALARDFDGNFIEPNGAISVRELSTGFPWNARTSNRNRRDDDHYAQRFSVTYVTGSHNFKVGVTNEQLIDNSGEEDHTKIGFAGESLGNVSYRFLRGVPNGVTQYATPSLSKNRVKADLGIYAQDQWTVRRLTLNYGVRFDYFSAFTPAQGAPAGAYVPERDFAEVPAVPLWKDINPRVGASYDLSGDGRTALKFAMGRYVFKNGLSLTGRNNPFSTSVRSVNRNWNDANEDFVVDCDLTLPTANGECGAFQNLNFGKNNPRALRYADDVLTGSRESNWDLSTELTHQLTTAVSVSGGYYRNWHSNFQATDNQAVSPEDYDPYCAMAPVDSRLPGGGGYEICGLYDITPEKFGQFEDVVTQASNFGDQTRVNDFLSFSFDTRFADVNLGGGIDTGRSVDNNCFVVDSPQQLRDCEVVGGFGSQTQFKMHGSYPLPGNFSVSGVFQNVSGPTYDAFYNVKNADIAASLGRNLAACGTKTLETCTRTARVNLIKPKTGFEGRRTQVDVRLTKVFDIGGSGRLQANLDVYNAFNRSPYLNINDSFGSRWRVPISNPALGGGILIGRLVEFSGRYSF
jgi:hypothetical protein